MNKPIINQNIKNKNPKDSIPTDFLGNPVANSGMPAIAKTDDGEVIIDGYVFSDELGYAKEAKKILSRYKYNKDTGELLRPNDKVTLGSFRKEVSDLIKQQEATRVSLADEAIGAPENELAKGGWIRKAANRMKKKGTVGAFTRYCGGKVTDECIRRALKSSNPTTRKRAGFAKAVRGFHKELGGYLDEYHTGSIDDLTGMKDGGSLIEALMAPELPSMQGGSWLGDPPYAYPYLNPTNMLNTNETYMDRYYADNIDPVRYQAMLDRSAAEERTAIAGNPFIQRTTPQVPYATESSSPLMESVGAPVMSALGQKATDYMGKALSGAGTKVATKGVEAVGGAVGAAASAISPWTVALQAAPAVYNVLRGIFGKTEKLDPQDYMINANIEAPKVDVTQQVTAAERGFATSRDAFRNSMSGMIAERTALAGSIGDIYSQKYNMDIQNEFRADLANLDVASRNAQTRMQVEQINMASSAAKENFLSQGLGQIGAMGYGFAQQGIQQKAYEGYTNLQGKVLAANIEAEKNRMAALREIYGKDLVPGVPGTMPEVVTPPPPVVEDKGKGKTPQEFAGKPFTLPESVLFPNKNIPLPPGKELSEQANLGTLGRLDLETSYSKASEAIDQYLSQYPDTEFKKYLEGRLQKIRYSIGTLNKSGIQDPIVLSEIEKLIGQVKAFEAASKGITDTTVYPK